MLCSRTALKCCFVLNGYILTKLTEHRSDQTRTEPGPQTGEECETLVDYFPFFKLEQPTFLGLWSSRRPHSSSSLSPPLSYFRPLSFLISTAVPRLLWGSSHSPLHRNAFSFSSVLRFLSPLQHAWADPHLCVSEQERRTEEEEGSCSAAPNSSSHLETIFSLSPPPLSLTALSLSLPSLTHSVLLNGVM